MIYKIVSSQATVSPCGVWCRRWHTFCLFCGRLSNSSYSSMYNRMYNSWSEKSASNATAACTNHFWRLPSFNHYSVLHGAVCLLKLVPSCLLSMTKCYRTHQCRVMSSYEYGNPVNLISTGNVWHHKLSEQHCDIGQSSPSNIVFIYF